MREPLIRTLSFPFVMLGLGTAMSGPFALGWAIVALIEAVIIALLIGI